MLVCCYTHITYAYKQEVSHAEVTKDAVIIHLYEGRNVPIAAADERTRRELYKLLLAHSSAMGNPTSMKPLREVFGDSSSSTSSSSSGSTPTSSQHGVISKASASGSSGERRKSSSGNVVSEQGEEWRAQSAMQQHTAAVLSSLAEYRYSST
jgi:hypothetical protein